MTDGPGGVPDDLFLKRVSLAMMELAKGMKSVNFYPEDHPILIQAITKIVLSFEEIPLPEEGLEIGVTRNSLLLNEDPLQGGGAGKALADLNRELYLRRAARIIFLPHLRPDEIVSFLKVVSGDAEKVLDAGGLENALANAKVSHIWANRVDYDQLTEMLKAEEELLEVEPEELPEDLLEAPPEAAGEFSIAGELPLPKAPTAEGLLAAIEKETDPARYREHVESFCRLLQAEPAERKLDTATRAVSLFVRHLEAPPGGNREIPELAGGGIRKLADDELVDHYIAQLKKAGLRSRGESETVLATVGQKTVPPLLQALAEEKDLLARKTIVSVIVRIGRAAVPTILENLNDSRWYMVRNLLTILGSLDMPDLAPHITSSLSHPDLRVKKEAIKALSRTSHPSAVTTLCELCFYPEETVALAATAALASKKEPEAVVALFKRVTTRKYLYPNYRLAHEAIDSLRVIGTDDAVTALEEILGLNVLWKTENLQAMKSHALRSISMIKGDKAREALGKALRSGDHAIRTEAERIMKRKLG